MALVKADRVKETSTTTGTGDFTLDGAVAGYRAFYGSMGVGDIFFYTILHSNGVEWETGYGTLLSTTTISRKWVHASSNLNSLVDFSAGTKEVFVSLTARQAHSGHLPNSGTTSAGDNSVNMNLYMGYQTANNGIFDTGDNRNILIGNRVFLLANYNNIGQMSQNTVIGHGACGNVLWQANSNGVANFDWNVIIGSGAASPVICGSNNVAIGTGVLSSRGNSTYNYCVVIGTQASAENYETDSVVIGYGAFSLGKENVVIGSQAGCNDTHENCIAIGRSVRSSGSNTTTIGHTTITDCYIRGNLHPSGAVRPASIADASAPTNAIYYSTTAGKLVYKDSGGTVNNLY
jgi:hypothetical protein